MNGADADGTEFCFFLGSSVVDVDDVVVVVFVWIVCCCFFAVWAYIV